MASAAADARSFLRDQRLFLSKCKNRVVVLDDGHSVREDSASHHRAAHEDLTGFFLVSAAESDHVVDHCSNRNNDVAGLIYGISVDRNSLLYKRHTVFEILSEEGYRCDVGHNTSQVSRKYARVAGLSCNFIDQDTLRSLGITRLQRECLDIRDPLLSKHSANILLNLSMASCLLSSIPI